MDEAEAEGAGTGACKLAMKASRGSISSSFAAAAVAAGLEAVGAEGGASNLAAFLGGSSEAMNASSGSTSALVEVAAAAAL